MAGQAFGGNRNTSNWKHNRVDPFYGYGQLDSTGMDPLRQGEATGAGHYGQGLANMQRAMAGYQGMADGSGPSLAQTMMARQTANNIAAQQSMAAQGGGPNAYRNAAIAGQAQQAAGAQALAEVRSQEQMGAIQGMAGVGGEMAGMGLQEQMGYGQMLNEAQIAQMQAASQYQQEQRRMQEAERNGRFGRRSGWANFGVEAGGKGIGAILSAISDERRKHDIVEADDTASNLAHSLAAIEYEYNDDVGIKGRRVGIKAQDLEKTPAGKVLVIEGPKGKEVDVAQATMAALAIGAAHERRMRRLEKAAKSKGGA